MVESTLLLQLQEYWWFLVGVLGAFFVFMSFVQGGQTLLYTIGKSEDHRDLIINTLGRKWELTFSALVLFGGAIFAAFPLFYATSFGGAYYVWIVILFCFIIQAVAYEYRKKPNNFFGARTYEWFLFINGSVGIIFIGIVLGTLFTGGNFTVNDMHLSRWSSNSYGLEAVLTFFNVVFGFMLFFLARLLAALYFLNAINDDAIHLESRRVLRRESGLFVVLFLYIMIAIFLMDGYNYDTVTKVVNLEANKFLHNIIALPWLGAGHVLGTVLVLVGLGQGIFTQSDKGIWAAGVGVILVVVSLFLLLGFNHTVFYPSLVDLQSSLTIENSSGSLYTLKTMAYVSLMVPFVLGYIIVVWRVMDREKITVDEVKNDPHHY